MLTGIALLLWCQLLGEVISRGLHLPVPGPVLGLLMLFGGLCVAGRWNGLSGQALEDSALGRFANGLLRSLGVFFVPAGVGVIQHLGLVGQYGARLILTLVLSTLITLLVTVFVFVGMTHWLAKPKPARRDPT